MQLLPETTHQSSPSPETATTPTAETLREYFEVEDVEAEEQTGSGDSEDPPLSAPPSPRADVAPTEPFTAPHFLPTVPHGMPIGRYVTRFERLKAEQHAKGRSPWYPFADEEEWELARWLVMSGLSQAEIDNFLKMMIVSTYLAVSKISTLTGEHSRSRIELNRHLRRNGNSISESICFPADLNG
jgi:hypothetical protein